MFHYFLAIKQSGRKLMILEMYLGLGWCFWFDHAVFNLFGRFGFLLTWTSNFRITRLGTQWIHKTMGRWIEHKIENGENFFWRSTKRHLDSNKYSLQWKRFVIAQKVDTLTSSFFLRTAAFGFFSSATSCILIEKHVDKFTTEIRNIKGNYYLSDFIVSDLLRAAE